MIFYASFLMKVHIVWHPHGMHGAHCPKDTNQKTSTYRCLKKEPLNFEHSFHFLAKTELWKCHFVVSSWIQEETSSEIWMRSALRTKACSLLQRSKAKSVILEAPPFWRRRVGTPSAEVFLVSVFLCHVWPASSHAVNRVSINIPSLGLSGHCKSLMPHLSWSHSFLSTVHIMTGERKQVKQQVWPSLPFSAA